MLSAFAVPAVLAAALAAPVQPSDDLIIESQKYRGSGCPRGSVDVKVGQNNDAILVEYEDFTVRADDDRRSCTIDLQLDPPAGWTVAVESISFGSTGRLGPGVTGTLDVTARGESRPGLVAWEFWENKEGAYFNEDLKMSRLSFASCDGPARLRFVSKLAIDGGEDDATPADFMSIEHPTYYGTQFNLRWQEC